ncbi:nitrate reductase [Ferrovibrio xuzhouensis]|uniref:Molybdopterin-dependent oxidoreductase n=1 Tax=Ferrovibrio xuzhouensis TaxID=1576914 RepID=A0ABV7V935_9PROT
MLQRIASKTRTTCPYCGVGCGLVVRRAAEDGAVSVAGDPDHPANAGRLCSKGSALAETLSLDDRLLHPLVNGQKVGWDTAIDLVADRFAQTTAEHGPDSVAFYVSGQLLTEDYYVANKLMKGFIGSANIDTNSRLCMASSVAGHKRAFGSDTVPGTYSDLDSADLVVLVGSNLAWCHPVLFQRLLAAKAARPEMVIVVVDPRRTMTAEAADLHLALKPGTDVALFNGLLAHLAASQAVDGVFTAQHTAGFDAALAALDGAGLAETAAVTGLPVADLNAFYDLFRRTGKVVTAYSQGVNQSSAGTDKVNSIINCHLYTGRIGRPGMGPFSITGQPNAMGGREVGGLANQLACHMELDNPEHRRIVQDFWQAPRMASRPGLKAVDLFEAVRAGKVKALWIAGTNPVDSLPDADRVRAALAACPFVVVSDVARHTDTTALAHVLLPAAAWGEKDGTVTNSERRISRQRGFLPLPGEAQPDWWIFAAVGRGMGWAEAFAYRNAAEIFAEYAALSGFRNAGTRDFDISAHAGITRDAYDSLPPFQWPLPAAGQPGIDGEKRFFAAGGFFTPDRRARFVPTPFRPARGATDERFPLVLNTGRIRDQWHTMTRTAKTSRLMAHIAEPFVELHPDDAAACGIAPGGLAVVESAHGHVIVRADITPAQRPGSVFVPMHWTDQLSAAGRIDAVVNAHTDPVSGQPELKFTPVRVRPFAAAWHGFALVAARPSGLATAYWAVAPVKGGGWRIELADTTTPEDWDVFAGELLGSTGAADSDMLAYHDGAAGQHRYAAFRDGCLSGALFVAPQPVSAARNWLIGRIGQKVADPRDRLRLLAGRAGEAGADHGVVVCSCFEVGVNQIATAIAQGCHSVEAVGAALQAGTNCGSCRSEIRKLINARQQLQNAG